MSTSPIDFSDLGGKRVDPSGGKLDFSDLGGVAVAPPQQEESWWHKTFAPRSVDQFNSELKQNGLLSGNVKGHPMPGSFEGHPENIGEYVPATAGRAAEGATDISRGNYAMGAHKLISAATNALAPVAPFAIAAAPLTSAATLAAGTGGQLAGTGVANTFGATPDQAALTGDLTGLGAGYGAAKTGLRFGEYFGMKSRASQGLQQIEQQIGDAPVDHTGIMKAIARVQDLSKKGYSMPKVASDFVNWINDRMTTHLTLSPDGAVIDSPPETMPLTWKDARDFHSAINDSIDWSTIPDKGGRLRGAMKQVQAASSDALRSVAKQNQMAGEYDTAMRNYGRAIRLEQKGYGIGSIAGRIVGYQSPIHPWATGYAGAKLGGPAGSALARSFLESPTPPPAPMTSRTAAATISAIMELAKNGEISPGEADRRISQLGVKVGVRKLSQPEAPPQ